MAPFIRLSVIVLVATATASVVACGGESISVGKTDQQLKTKRDGTPTGDGSTCSWAGTADVTTSSDGTVSNASTATTYSVNDDFKSPDGCNDCQCTARGIMCTMRACSSPPSTSSGGTACDAMARVCNDGSIAKVGPNCAKICPEDSQKACTEEAKQCPDGSYVSRTGPNCEFAPCPSGGNTACPQDAKQCPNGSYVSRTGPNCEFAPCP